MTKTRRCAFGMAALAALALHSCGPKPRLIEPRPLSLYQPHVCARFEGETAVDYCYSLPREAGGVPQRPAVYAFYEEGGNPAAFFNSGIVDEMEGVFREQPARAPVFLALSFGPYWVAGSGVENPAGARYRALLDFFDKVEPQLVHPVGRTLLGVGLGGFNALSLYLRFPQAFSGAAAACPLLYDFDPLTASAEDVERFRGRAGKKALARDRATVVGIREGSGLEAGEWEALSPRAIAARMVNRPDSRAYLATVRGAAGRDADLAALAEALRAKGLAVELQILERSEECRLDPRGIARFIAVSPLATLQAQLPAAQP